MARKDSHIVNHAQAREAEVDETLSSYLAFAIETVGRKRYMEAPLVFLDAHCFPDPWEPTLVGVRTALRRLLRYVGLPDVPVAVVDDRLHPSRGSPPAVFAGIEHGTVCFKVKSIAPPPPQLVGWLTLEAVRAWVAYQSTVHVDALAYRALPNPPSAPIPNERLDVLSAGAIAVALGLGPLLVVSATQAYPRQLVRGGFLEGDLRLEIAPLPLARLLAIHGVSRGDVPDELMRVREGLDGDLRLAFDAARAKWTERTSTLRVQHGMSSTWRRPIDASPLPALDEVAAVQAEQSHARKRRFFNEGRPIYAVIERRTGAGGMAGMFLGVPVVFAAVAWVGPVGAWLYLGCIVVGSLVGRTRTFLRCSDQHCRGHIAADAATCSFCGGTIKGRLRSVDDRLDD